MSELGVFMETCSVGVHPSTVAEVVEYVGPTDLNLLRILTPVGDVLTASVDGKNDGIAKAIKELEKGSSVSVGVMQVSSDYWLEYDVNVFDMWEPCTNITVGTTILAKEYVSALERTGRKHEAFKIAIQNYLEENLYTNASSAVEEMFKPTRRPINLEYEKEHWSSEMVVSGFVARTQDFSNYEFDGENNDF